MNKKDFLRISNEKRLEDWIAEQTLPLCLSSRQIRWRVKLYNQQLQLTYLSHQGIIDILKRLQAQNKIKITLQKGKIKIDEGTRKN